jgi:hypothetical protein
MPGNRRNLFADTEARGPMRCTFAMSAVFLSAGCGGLLAPTDETLPTDVNGATDASGGGTVLIPSGGGSGAAEASAAAESGVEPEGEDAESGVEIDAGAISPPLCVLLASSYDASSYLSCFVDSGAGAPPIPEAGAPSISGEFAGTWSCSLGGETQDIAIVVNGDALTETFSTTFASQALTCMGVFTVMGATATLVPGSISCDGLQIPGLPTDGMESLTGDTLTLVEASPGSAPISGTCTKE